MSLINTLTKYLKRFLSPRLQDTDFSTFVPAVPLTRKQQLIEECQRKNVSICDDDPSEQSAIFRGVVSVPELERRLNANKVITLSKCANVIATLVLIALVIPIIKPFL